MRFSWMVGIVVTIQRLYGGDDTLYIIQSAYKKHVAPPPPHELVGALGDFLGFYFGQHSQLLLLSWFLATSFGCFKRLIVGVTKFYLAFT